MTSLNLPKLIAKCEERFNVKIGDRFKHQSHNFAAKAIQSDGTVIVVKICNVPTSGVKNEINALEFMRGDGIVQLLDSDTTDGILLLEYLNPGKMLSTLTNDNDAVIIAADVMQKIWKPLSGQHNFPTTVKWFDRLSLSINLPTGFPISLIDKAEQIALALHQDMGESVLLHGDLHHFNILSANRQSWIAIDPKGIAGEREYEIGAFLRNPIPDIATTMDTKKVLTRRIDQFTELLDLDRQKIISWGFAQAVLAAVWCVDGNMDDWKVFVKCAEVLSEINNSSVA